MRCVGVTARGIRLPVLKNGDNLGKIVVDCLMEASKNEPFVFHDKDVVGITESIVARCQGNYASVDDIAEDIKGKINGKTLGLIFPIMSRNRFSILLKGIARGAKKIVLMLSYPSDEVGNALLSEEKIMDAGVNPYTDVLDLVTYRKLFGKQLHQFTGVDYIDFYQEIIRGQGCDVEVIFGNRAEAILNYTDTVLCADIHSRFKSVRILKEKGAQNVFTLADILNKKSAVHGYNLEYGLLGSNKSDEEKIKLFPRDGQGLVEEIQNELFKLTGKKIEVMVYGDGAFKDPVGKIWELADPVVSPFYTDGLKGTPNELKLKYLADNDFSNESGDKLNQDIKEKIKNKDSNLYGNMASQGTTPRQITDLLGSLCDLVSGSGDKGTPVILVQGYFDNFASE